MDATSRAFSAIRHRIGRLAGTGARHGVHSLGRIVLQRSGLRDGVVIVLALVPFAAPAPSRTIGVAWRRSSPRGRDFRALADLIRRACAPR